MADRDGPVPPEPVRHPGTGADRTGPGHAPLELAMRIGEAMLSAGMSASDVVVMMLRITGAYRLRHVHIDVTYTAITVSQGPNAGAPPFASIRAMRRDVVDYTKVRELDRLSDRIEAGLPVDRAVAAFERITSAPHRYPEWVRTVANAGVGASVSLLLTASWRIILITFLTGCALDRMLRRFDRWRVPPFFQQFAATLLIAVIAATVVRAGAHGVGFFAGLNATLIVVSGIVMLVAGMMIVGAVQDAIDQFYVTAAARVFEVFMRTAGIVTGITLALQTSVRVGFPLSISADPVGPGPPAAQFVGATLTAAFFALSAYADAVTILLAAAMGLLGWVGYSGMVHLDTGEVMARAAGALLAALVATVLVRRTHVPGFGLVSAALLPLVPGLTLYNGLLQTIAASPGSGELSTGISTLVLACGVALGIAAGVSLGTYLGRPIGDRLHRTALLKRRYRRRGAGRAAGRGPEPPDRRAGDRHVAA